MDVIQLKDELSKKSPEEIQFLLQILLIEGKLSFTALTSAYVAYLEYVKEDNENKLIEAETCVLESFLYNKGDDNEASHKSTLRALYLLNKSKRFNGLDDWNKKYGYNEEEAKQLSWYERNKKYEQCVYLDKGNSE